SAAPNDVIYGKAGSLLGSGVAIGDINGDGSRDVVVSAPQAARPEDTTDTQVGATFAIFGGSNLTPAGGATTKTFDINATAQNVSVYGNTAGDHLGASIAVGDVTGDGTADLAIGAPDAAGPGNTRTGAGEAYVIAGGSNLNPPSGKTERRIDVALG